MAQGGGPRTAGVLREDAGRRNRHNQRWYRDRWTTERNIVSTATGVKQDLGALQRIVEKTAREIPK
jgi:hypothetical protein